MGPPRVAIVGRPNTGKSTFVNKVFGSDRMIVSEVPGTTRDPIDTAVELDGQPLVLVDTAGIRRRGSIDRGIERYSVLRSMKAIDSADVAVVMTDATEGYTAQDAHVVGYVLEAGKGVVLVLNKWDAVEKDEYTADQWLKRLRREAPYLAWADIVFASALTGQRVERILKEALRVAEERYRRVSTGELNRLVMDAVRDHPPSHVRNRLPKFYYAAQVSVAPPTFVIFVNDPAIVHFSYKRYLENRIRDAYGFLGTPIRLILRAARVGGVGTSLREASAARGSSRESLSARPGVCSLLESLSGGNRALLGGRGVAARGVLVAPAGDAHEALAVHQCRVDAQAGGAVQRPQPRVVVAQHAEGVEEVVVTRLWLHDRGP